MLAAVLVSCSDNAERAVPSATVTPSAASVSSVARSATTVPSSPPSATVSPELVVGSCRRSVSKTCGEERLAADDARAFERRCIDTVAGQKKEDRFVPEPCPRQGVVGVCVMKDEPRDVIAFAYDAKAEALCRPPFEWRPVPSSEAECASSPACKETGRCGFRPPGRERVAACIPTQPDHCRKSEACTRRGDCSIASPPEPDAPYCHPGSVADCEASTACEKETLCALDLKTDSCVKPGP